MEQEGVEQQIFLQPEMAVIGGGAVSSVNGYTGDVVLTTSDLENTSDYQTGSEVQAAISIEATAREDADNNLQTQIDAISASSDVTDIVGTYAELQNYDTSTLGDNDIIKVLQDESQNGETTYYRWSTTTQSFTLIGEEGPYYTKAQADALLNAKQDTLTAGANIQISNNTISATDTTYSDFTGTDGTAAGAAGLVPAPATTDAGKFLKADGTWDDAGGGVTVLTADDYNWPTVNPNGVALWRLSPGLYNWDNGVRVYTSASSSNTNGASAFVTEAAGNAREYVEVVRFYPGGGNNTYNWSKVNYNTGAVVSNIDNAHLLSDKNVVQTTGTSPTDIMSQKAVTDAIAAIPTGGDAFTELTASDYNYPADNPDGIALWLLPLGLYKFTEGVKVYFASNAGTYTASTSNPVYTGVMLDNVGGITGQKLIIQFAYHSSGTHLRDTMKIYKINNAGVSTEYATASYVLRATDIYNGLNQASAGYALDATQGRILNDKIVGATSTTSISPQDWSALADSSPYNYQHTTVMSGVSSNSSLELINDNPVLFAKHGFAIAGVTTSSSGASVTIYSIGLPDDTVALNIIRRG